MARRKRILTGLIAATLLCLATSTFAADKIWINVDGYVLLANERGVVVKKTFTKYRDVTFADKDKKVAYFKCLFDKMENQIAVKDIARIVRNLPEGDYLLYTRSGEKFHVESSRDLSYALTNMPHMEIKYFNKITGKYDLGYIPGWEIQEIVFNTEAQIGE